MPSSNLFNIHTVHDLKFLPLLLVIQIIKSHALSSRLSSCLLLFLLLAPVFLLLAGTPPFSLSFFFTVLATTLFGLLCCCWSHVVFCKSRHDRDPILYSSLSVVQVALLLGDIVYKVFHGRKVLFIVRERFSV